MTEKTRLDIALFERGFAESREKAKALIMAGIVFVNNQKSDKAGNTVKPDDIIEVRGETLKYVSRGGLKLEKAVASFNISLEGCVCADIGASRRLYRLYAAKRRGKGLFYRCRLRSACMEIENGRKSGKSRTYQFQICDSRAGAR